MARDPHGLSAATADGPSWRAWRGEASVLASSLFAYVRRLEQANYPHYDQMFRAGMLYDPGDPKYAPYIGDDDPFSSMQENVIAQSADSLAASISSQIRVRIETVGGTWSEQRRARRLEAYSDGIDKALGDRAAISVGNEIRTAFLKGSSFVYVDIEGGKIVRRHVPSEQIFYDPEQLRGGHPSQIFMVELVDREELKAAYPKAAKAIDEDGRHSGLRNFTALQNGRDVMSSSSSTMIVVLRAWSVPTGAAKGRYVVATERAVLLDEEHKGDFPLSKLDWSPRETDYFAISGAGRIEGTQRELNRRNRAISNAIDNAAAPVTYVSPADANLAVRSVSRFGAVAVVTGAPPVTVDHKMVNAETYASREGLVASAFREIGGIPMAQQSLRPPGVESGVGLREYRDQKSERHAMQQALAEEHAVRIRWLTLECCKRLGKSAPKIPNRRKFPSFSKDEIEWGDVDMGDVRVQMSAASTLPKTPSGLRQMVVELAQAGAITTEEFRRLIDHPDLEREMSLYNAAIEKIEYAIEAIANGVPTIPSPTDHLQMAVVRAQRQLGIWETVDGAPEEVLDALRDYISTATWMLEQAASPQDPAAASLPPDPMISGATGMPPASPPA